MQFGDIVVPNFTHRPLAQQTCPPGSSRYGFTVADLRNAIRKGL